MDDREGFSHLAKLIPVVQFFHIENVNFEARFPTHVQLINTWYGVTPDIVDLSAFSAQTRQRAVWASDIFRDIPPPSVSPDILDCLDDGWRMVNQAHKCGTLMTRRSYSDSQNLVQNQLGQTRNFNIHERERIVGFRVDDTLVDGISLASRQKITGNAIPILYLQHLWGAFCNRLYGGFIGTDSRLGVPPPASFLAHTDSDDSENPHSIIDFFHENFAHPGVDKTFHLLQDAG